MILFYEIIATILLLWIIVEIRKANFRFYVLCYEQTSPLAVSTYSFGASCGLTFVRSEHFFLFSLQNA